MDTLLLQLVAPLQSWGVQSLYGDRDSALEPSKSGVTGLLCAALGRDRNEPVADLASLRMAVRVDREGRLSADFHKAEPLDRNLKPAPGSKVTIGQRRYLADAAFLVALEGERLVLQEVHAALKHPVYMLYLGRKAFPPSAPVYLEDGLFMDAGIQQVLSAYPPVASSAPERRRVVIEDPNGEMMINDQPISFAERQFAPRRVHIDYWVFPKEV